MMRQSKCVFEHDSPLHYLNSAEMRNLSVLVLNVIEFVTQIVLY